MYRMLSAALLAAGITAAASSITLAEPVEREGNVYHVAVCKRLIPDTEARCLAHVVTDSQGHVLSQPAGSKTTPAGLGATDLESAYNMTTMGSSKTIVAIVDAFGYPSAEADLGMYRAQYGLPPCTTANGCFTKLNQKGNKNGRFPPENVGWAVETALDLDMASAMCPNCRIMLVEARTNSFKNLAAAEDTAAAKGAHVISNSYTGGDRANITPYAESYHHPGIAITAATGDDGYQGAAFPASSPYTTAVGGTALTKDANVARGWTETAWSGAGSGCSKFAAKPAWQKDKKCTMRMMADVSAVASPATAVAIYAPLNANQSGWTREGGTSVATPLVAGVYGNNGGAVNYGSDPYAHTDALYDVTSGSNGSCGNSKKKAYYCHAEVGYDGPTGLGTPNGNTAF